MSFALSLIAAAFYSVSSAMLTLTLKSRKAATTDVKPLSARPMAANDSFAAPDKRCTPAEPASAESAARNRQLMLGFATAAMVLHAWVVIKQTGLPDGLSLPLFTSISATALTIVLLLIALCLREPADYLGLAVYPGAALSLIASEAAAGGTHIVGHGIQMHVLLSLVSYSVLSLAAAQAVLVAIQRHYLSVHKPGGFIRSLPPLDTTERLLFTLLSAGFILLSLALASGFVYLDNMFDQQVAHKTILSCFGWAIFGILLYGRWQFGWRGKKVVQWTLGGFAVLVLAYFGTKVIVEVVLGQ